MGRMERRSCVGRSGDNDYEKVRHAPRLAELVDVKDDSILSRSPSLKAFLELATR